MLSDLFKVFSRRDKTPSASHQRPLSREFRNRTIMLLQDHLNGSFAGFLECLQRKFSYLHGRHQLSQSETPLRPAEDLLRFLHSCKDEHFLDLIELTFQSHYPGITWPDNPLIQSINEFFFIDNLPYYLTGYSVEHEGATSSLAEYPRVIRKDNEAIHQNATQPALHILSSSEFRNANAEFLRALEDQRKGDFQDCLTKCGSAFESVMKVLCSKRSISYKQTDSAAILLRLLLANGNLDSYWEQPLILIATIRNRLSSSHGAGMSAKTPPAHVANYAINATASAILLLHAEFS